MMLLGTPLVQVIHTYYTGLGHTTRPFVYAMSLVGRIFDSHLSDCTRVEGRYESSAGLLYRNSSQDDFTK